MADPEGVRGSTEPNLESKLFHFHGEFCEHVEKIIGTRKMELMFTIENNLNPIIFSIIWFALSMSNSLHTFHFR